MKVLVIADDYTGALDTGVQFASRGARTLVTTAVNFKSAVAACIESGAAAGIKSGAADVGLNPFAAGYDFASATADNSDNFDVLAVDAGSRHLSPREAYNVVFAIVRDGVRLGFTHFYKKTDSALRGNVGAELAAALEAACGGVLAFAPAYPKSGRVTSGGIQYVDGKPLAESVFANDPFSPVKFSEVLRILRTQTNAAAVNYAAGVYRGTAGGAVSVNISGAVSVNMSGAVNGNVSGAVSGNLSGEVSGGLYSGTLANPPEDNRTGESGRNRAGGSGRNRVGGPVIEIYDAESDADLLSLGYYLKDRNKLKLLAGCAGFAGVLPEVYGLGEYAKHAEPAKENRRHAPRLADPHQTGGVHPRLTEFENDKFLFVTGSVNPITFKQVAAAADERFHKIILSPEQKLCLSPTHIGQLADTVLSALRAGKRVVLAAAGNNEDVMNTDALASRNGLDPAILRNLICENIARITVDILNRRMVDALAVFGGDTLYEILRQARIDAVTPVREISPGVAEAYAAAAGGRLRLITKSGGLGGENVIAEISGYAVNR